ncbi:MAG TPA: hypothetical protein VLT61_02030 [Anaeromyxobacteraceae bacterium]|nr:hypothetical protein [Anaeromyxobacteraceae bacterium]
MTLSMLLGAPARAVAFLLLTATAAAAEPPLPAPIASAEAIEPNGVRLTLSASTEAIVDPTSTFRIVLPGRSDDARLSLLDAAENLVPARATREVGAETVLTVTPVQPLAPASRYLLRLDGARARDLHDAAGRAAGPVELRLVAAGAPPEPEKKTTRRKRRR